MSASQPNAFSDPGDRQTQNQPGPNGLAAALAPLQAELKQQGTEWHLTLSPMRAFDAMRCWAELSDAEHPNALLFDVEHAAGNRFDSALATVPSLEQLAQWQDVPVLERYDEEALIIDPVAACEVIGAVRPTQVRAVLVDGPIEIRDARAMIEASRAGESPLLYECRAVAAIEVGLDRVVRLVTRKREDGIRLVAENFRHYLGALRRRSHEEHAPPELWQLERLFDISGMLTVRPIETEMFSTSMDIGISTAGADISQPADESLIYDLPSDTWHDEP